MHIFVNMTVYKVHNTLSYKYNMIHHIIIKKIFMKKIKTSLLKVYIL